MPRLALQDYQVVVGIKKGILEKYIFLRKYDDGFMASKIGITKQCFQYKRKAPEKFTGEELAKINIILQIPQDEWI